MRIDGKPHATDNRPMPEPAKTPEHPQVTTLRESIKQREERLKSAKGDEKAAQEAVLEDEKARLSELQKSLK
jgi:hypothetical protein